MSEAPPFFRVGADEVRLLCDGAEAFPAMLEAIAGAEREIVLEMYWIADDVCGRRFRDALAERARAGVRVRVVYDAIGSLGLPANFFAPLERYGGEVHEYHPLSPLRSRITLDSLERRDHRKLLAVDGRQAFVGGLNLGREWMTVEEGGEGWRDDVVQVRGPAAEEVRALFYDTWRRRPWSEVPADVRRLPRRRTRPVWVLANRWRRQRSIRREYLRRIARAHKSIDIANSYFVPNRSFRGALLRAALRGVRVRILVPERSDIAVVQLAVEALFGALLRAGIEIYQMTGRILHSKTVIVDDVFTMVGSYNLDERSFRKNLECNLAVEDERFAAHARARFERDCAASRRVDLATWSQRPWSLKALQAASYALRRLW
jgi:cardiolipin synthase